MVIGVTYEIKATEMFSIQPEVFFSSKGMKMEMDESILGESMKMTSVTDIYYIKIPVLFKLNIPVEVMSPNVYVGPAVAFRSGVGGYAEANGEKVTYGTDEKKAMEEMTNTVDFGLAFGAGVAIPAGPGAVVIDARYIMGLMKIGKDGEGDVEDVNVEEDDTKNGVLAFMIGYSFNIGGN